SIPVRTTDDGKLEVAMVDPTDVELLGKLETMISMTVTPLIAPESSILMMIDKVYPELRDGDSTLATHQRTEPRNQPSDPVFLDLIESLDATDIEQRLSRIEENLSQIWILLERILRSVEKRAPHEPMTRDL